MITITTEGIDDLLQGLQGMHRQIPYAAANGINATARRVKGAVYTAMGLVFDRPTPFTMNSLQLTPALAPKTIEAQVWFKDPPSSSNADRHFLLPQVEGGRRPLKPFERGLVQAFLGKGGRYAVPSKYAKDFGFLDQYGNLGRGQITKLLSIAGGFHEVGFDMNVRSKAKKMEYFTIVAQNGKLPPGLYKRVIGNEAGGRMGRFLLARAIAKKGKQKGQLRELTARTKALYPRGARPVVLFPGKAPNYRKTLDFYGIADSVVDQHLRSDMEAAVAAETEREMAYRARHGR